MNDFACASCGHEQATMDPCAKCGSVRTVLISVLENLAGSSWRHAFKDPPCQCDSCKAVFQEVP